jgi:hypothetical protein
MDQKPIPVQGVIARRYLCRALFVLGCSLACTSTFPALRAVRDSAKAQAGSAHPKDLAERPLDRSHAPWAMVPEAMAPVQKAIAFPAKAMVPFFEPIVLSGRSIDLANGSMVSVGKAIAPVHEPIASIGKAKDPVQETRASSVQAMDPARKTMVSRMGSIVPRRQAGPSPESTRATCPMAPEGLPGTNILVYPQEVRPNARGPPHRQGTAARTAAWSERP